MGPIWACAVSAAIAMVFLLWVSSGTLRSGDVVAHYYCFEMCRLLPSQNLKERTSSREQSSMCKSTGSRKQTL